MRSVLKSTYRLGKVAMNLCELDRHVPQIRNLLALEPVQVGLQGGRSVLQVLRGRLQRVLQL